MGHVGHSPRIADHVLVLVPALLRDVALLDVYDPQAALCVYVVVVVPQRPGLCSVLRALAAHLGRLPV